MSRKMISEMPHDYMVGVPCHDTKHTKTNPNNMPWNTEMMPFEWVFDIYTNHK